MHFHSLFLMSEGLTRGLQLFVALSILIALHEFGHYFFAKVFKTRVEKFYLFFDFLFPFSGLLNFSIFKKTIGETTYGVGWFPLGGYVKIAGMVDESMDKEQMAQPPQPWEFRSKPAWQRLFIMLGGIIVNVLVAMIVYMFMFGIYGETYLPAASTKWGISVDSVGRSIGLQNGDKVLSVDGKKIERFKGIGLAVFLDAAKTIEVDRDGKQVVVPIPDGTIRKMLKKQGTLIAPRVPIVIGQVTDKSEAKRMQLLKDDSVIAINNTPIQFFDEFRAMVTSLKGQPIRLTVVRNGGQVAVLNGTVPENGQLGVYNTDSMERFFEFKKISYSAGEAFTKGITHTWDQFGFYWKQFKMLFTSKEVKFTESVGGIGSFAKMFPGEFDMHEFLNLLAFVSIILAFMNLLPIPGLDGGYVIFLLFEMITGRKVSEKVMEVATTIGLVLLLALMLFANGMDIFRWIGGK